MTDSRCAIRNTTLLLVFLLISKLIWKQGLNISMCFTSGDVILQFVNNLAMVDPDLYSNPTGMSGIEKHYVEHTFSGI